MTAFFSRFNAPQVKRMAEASATPLARKLGIKPGHRLAFVNPPGDFPRTLGPLPTGCVHLPLDAQDAVELDVVVCFGESFATLANAFPDLKNRLASNGGLWLCWPKKASGVKTDLSDSVVQRIGLNGGLVDNKICSIDAIWSAMRFVYRLQDRPS
jgi:hypothetical protein